MDPLIAVVAFLLCWFIITSAIAGMLTSITHTCYFDLLMFEAFTVGLWIGVGISQDDSLYPASPDPSSQRHSAKSSRTMAGNVTLTATHTHPWSCGANAGCRGRAGACSRPRTSTTDNHYYYSSFYQYCYFAFHQAFAYSRQVVSFGLTCSYYRSAPSSPSADRQQHLQLRP